MEDFPVLTDVLPSTTELKPIGALDVAVAEPTPTAQFYEFFWAAEVLRQQLFERFNYKVIRRIEHLSDGTACVKLVCPPLGNGEPGSRPKQVTLTVGSASTAQELKAALAYLNDALKFLLNQQEMLKLAEATLGQLSERQLEALRWALPKLLKKA
jgi:hypothetical protein